MSSINLMGRARTFSNKGGNNTKFSKLDYEDDVSIVAVLGRGMIGTPGIAGRVFSTVAKHGINIRMIAQGSSEINISFVIKDKDRNKAVTALHEEFVVVQLDRLAPTNITRRLILIIHL